MTPEFAYFLKVNAALALFYAFYRLFFYKDTFFGLRRAILLIFFGLAIAYPLLNLQQWMSEQEPLAGVIEVYSAILPEVNVYTEAETSASDSYLWLIPATYLTVVAALLLRFVMQLGSILWLAFRSKRVVIEDTNVYVLANPAGPFSFFNLIFLHPASHSEKEVEEILAHESTHASQMHSIDVIISELICIVCWINPFVWLLKREVRHNLEYLADNRVLQSGFDSQSYQYHLLGLAHNHQAAANLYNGFNVLHLKNRIRMMNKKRSRAIGRTKYLMFIPLTALLMLLSNLAACSVGEKAEKAEESPNPEVAEAPGVTAEAQNQPDNGVFTVVDEMPKYPGGDGALLKFIADSIKYPAEAQENGIQGRVVAYFIVNQDGSISNPTLLKGVEPSLDEEALRIIKSMPKWTPGKIKGEPVRVKYTIPVTFRLSAGDDSQKEQGVDNKSDVNRIYTQVDEMPKFPGGDGELLKFLANNIKYPVEAKEKKLEGRVAVAFVVNKDGSLSNPEVVRSLAPLLDEEALRVVALLPKFAPGKKKGEPVNVQYIVPVTFRLL
ncbi:cell envelope biogenesis protein TonB [Bacteroidia bacterium]|nr:cell envelope biogenesis protein TonB [Bacteroidia bacterium]